MNEVRQVELVELGQAHENDTAWHRVAAPLPKAGTVCWVTEGPGASEALRKGV